MRPEGGWHGTFVGHDGGPESLGAKLLDLIFHSDGDLDQVWKNIAEADAGWNGAFDTPYEAGENDDYFNTGRAGPPLLCDTDAFVRDSAVYWYIFDLGQRTLSIYQNTEDPPLLYDRVTFNPAGATTFERGSLEPTDWRSRREGAHSDDDPSGVISSS